MALVAWAHMLECEHDQHEHRVVRCASDLPVLGEAAQCGPKGVHIISYITSQNDSISTVVSAQLLTPARLEVSAAGHCRRKGAACQHHAPTQILFVVGMHV